MTSYTLITTAPNAVLERLCDRMPVIVAPTQFDAWLDPATPLARTEALLAPYAVDAMRSYPISRLVNSTSNDAPEILEPMPMPMPIP